MCEHLTENRGTLYVKLCLFKCKLLLLLHENLYLFCMLTLQVCEPLIVCNVRPNVIWLSVRYKYLYDILLYESNLSLYYMFYIMVRWRIAWELMESLLGG